MDEEDNEPDERPTRLCDAYSALFDIKMGVIFTGGSASSLPAIPGLCVTGVGPVPLPLSERSSVELEEVASPHHSFRNLFQIEPNMLTFQNLSWEPALQALVAQVAEKLGVESSRVEARLEKLLLFKEGGFLKRNGNAKTECDRFATLMIQLPSHFTDGSLAVSHGSETHSFEFGAGGQAQYECHFAAFYADCDFNVRSIKSGRRLAILYSLHFNAYCRDLGWYMKKPTATNVLSQIRELAFNLKHIRKDDSLFLLPLEELYTTDSFQQLGVGALKGTDSEKFQAIEAATAQLSGWKVMIAKLKATSQSDRSFPPIFVDKLYNDDGSFALASREWPSKQSDSSVPLFMVDGLRGADASRALEARDGLSKQLRFYSVNRGGTVFASGSSSIKDSWKGCKSEYSESFEMEVLVFFLEDCEFERTCRSDFKGALNRVRQSSDLLGRLLVYIRQRKHSLGACHCISILELFEPEELTEKQAKDGLSTIIGALSTVELSPVELSRVVTELVKRFEWSQTMLQDLVAGKIKDCKTKSVLQFLAKMEFVLQFKNADNAEFF